MVGEGGVRDVSKIIFELKLIIKYKLNAIIKQFILKKTAMDAEMQAQSIRERSEEKKRNDFSLSAWS